MKLLNSKKGFNLTEVPTLAVILLVIAIVLGIGGSILGKMADSEIGTASLFDSNSTFRAINGTAVEFGTENAYDSVYNDFLVASSCSGVIIKNYTAPHADVTSDFTVSGCTASMKAAATDNHNNTLVTANYTYNHYTYSTAYNVTTEGLDAQSDLSDWQGTWVVIVAAAVVLGIVGRYLFFKN